MNLSSKNYCFKSFAQTHYILFSIIATLLMVIPVSFFLRLSSADLKQGLVGIDIMLVRLTTTVGIFIFIRLFLPDGKLVLGRKYNIFTGIIFGLPYLVLSFLSTVISNFGADFSSVEIPSVTILLLFVGNMFLIGFNEEFLFRGLILNNLFIRFGKTDNALKKAIWISSVCFGFMHVVNIFVSSAETTLIQMIMAIFGGVLFCGIYLKSRNIWVAVIIHTLLDLIAFILSIMNISSVLNVQYQWYEGLIVMAVGSLIQLGYGFLLLKNLKTSDL